MKIYFYIICLHNEKKARTGDHLWWISDNSRFIKDYPNFRIKYNIEKVIEELITNI